MAEIGLPLQVRNFRNRANNKIVLQQRAKGPFTAYRITDKCRRFTRLSDGYAGEVTAAL